MPVTWPGAPSNASWADLGLRGVRRAKSPRTTRSVSKDQCPADLVKRHFEAFAPNELRVANITYVRTFSGWVYVAFMTDGFSRRIVGWQTSTSLYTDLALDALEMAVWQRKRQGATGACPWARGWRDRAVVEDDIGAGSWGRGVDSTPLIVPTRPASLPQRHAKPHQSPVKPTQPPSPNRLCQPPGGEPGIIHPCGQMHPWSVRNVTTTQRRSGSSLSTTTLLFSKPSGAT